MSGEHGSADLRVTAERSDRELVLVLEGELDLTSAPAITQACSGLVPGAVPIVVDLRRLTFVDSTGLAQLLWLHRFAKAAGTRIRFVPGPPQVQRLFELAGMAQAVVWEERPAAP